MKLLSRLGGRTRIADGGGKSEISKSPGKSEIDATESWRFLGKKKDPVSDRFKFNWIAPSELLSWN